MDSYPEENLSGHETDTEDASEDESEDEMEANLEFDFGQVRIDSDDEEIEENENNRHGCI